ncbi:MAG: DUF3347 domain-containing protein [Cyclobacteriaceae bacterium]
MKKTILLVSLALMSWGASAQHDHANHNHSTKEMGKKGEPMFKDKAIGKSYAQYLQLKDALIASKGKEAQNAAAELAKALASVKNGKQAQAQAAKIAATATLDTQRQALNPLSDEMLKLVKGQLSMGEIYLEYCPMANQNTGGKWLSNEKEIKNPYFGSMMLSCGAVKETIK